MFRKSLLAATLLVILASSAPVSAQTTPVPPPPPDAESAPAHPTPAPQSEPAAPADPQPATPPAEPEGLVTSAVQPDADPAAAAAEAPPVLSDAASRSYERRDGLPNINLYLPEGQASIRLRKLIRNALFESQIDYNFVDGDISTYLRYKYYARNYTYRLSVFDSIEFPDLASNDDLEFERVRGGLLLVGVPLDYNNRWYWLLQNDRLTFGDLTRVDNATNNVYTKIGYQFGTQFDERLNAIVGESRGRIAPVLTAFREIGSENGGLAAAVTYSDNVVNGDYEYTKFEAEGLRRFDITQTSFVFSRLHLGTFLQKKLVRGEEYAQVERYSVPRYELFRLGGREALKSISADESSQGLHEIHLTNELFVPIFRNRDYKTGVVRWNNLYGIGYVGAGAVAFDTSDITESDRLVVDAGIGAETGMTIRDFDVYLSVVFATGVTGPEELQGSKVRVSIRTVR